MLVTENLSQEKERGGELGENTHAANDEPNPGLETSGGSFIVRGWLVASCAAEGSFMRRLRMNRL